MSLARIKTWNPGDVLTANDLNNEFNNYINNPISLVSPTTGTINFNLQAHTNLVPGAITATSGAVTGVLVISSDTATVWASAGTTGQVLTISSSGVKPTWGVIPPDGGLSTGTVSTGAIYYISTDGKLLPLSIGTSGQVLTVSTASKPSWAAASAASAEFGLTNGNTFSTVETWWDDFHTATKSVTYANTSGALSFTYPTSGPNNGLTAPLITGNNSGATIQAVTYAPFVLHRDMTLTIRTAHETTTATVVKIGLGTSGAATNGILALVDPTDGLFFRTSASGSTWAAVAVNGGTTFEINTTAVCSTAFTTLQAVVTSSGTLCTIYANGVSQGTFTSSQLSTAAMNFAIAQTGSNVVRIDGWQVKQQRGTTV